MVGFALTFNRGLPELWWYGKIDNPPVFESQAAYLKRHKLFLEGEEEKLTQDHFKPEFV